MSRSAEVAERAVAALRAEADLTPKPGLVDRRGSGAHCDMDLETLYTSAEALREWFVQCADAARTETVGPALRSRLGIIGRSAERAMLAATGGINTHRGALWGLGLLAAGAAADLGPRHAVQVATKLARLSDYRSDAAATFSHGSVASRRYGANGARGEARAGFPHVTRYAVPTLQAARADGADETDARLDALLSIMARLDDTCVLYRGGQAGLAVVRRGAASVLTAGGCRTSQGRFLLARLDEQCIARRLSPGGSGDLLAATLFLDSFGERKD